MVLNNKFVLNCYLAFVLFLVLVNKFERIVLYQNPL